MREVAIWATETAVEVLGSVELPANLEEQAFSNVQRALLRARLESARGPRAAVEIDPEGDDPDGQSAALAAISRATKVPLEVVDQVFYDADDGAVAIGLPGSKFGTKKSAAVRKISLLIAVARQLGGDEQWTAATALRDACQEYNVYDGNFATYLTSLDDIFQFQGSGAARRVRLTRPAHEKAAELMKALVG